MKSQGLSCGWITQALLTWGGRPFPAVCRGEEVQSLIARPKDRQGKRKREGEWMNTEIREKTKKGTAAHVLKVTCAAQRNAQTRFCTHTYSPVQPQSMTLATATPLWC